MLQTINQLVTTTPLDKLEIKVLLRHVLKLTQAELIMYSDRILSESEISQFNQLVEQRLLGFPIHYILGYREFYSRQFIVTRDTLIPRPETELLVSEVLQLIPRDISNIKLLDLGTGSGCIAISCKLEASNIEVVAVDKYMATLDIARKNASKLGACITFIQSDWYEKINGKFNLIVSNPPYIASGDAHLAQLKYEPEHALTDFSDGLLYFHQIISGAQRHLLAKGYLILEHGFDQALAIKKLLANGGFTNIKTIRDYAMLERVTIAQYENGRNQD